MIDSMAHAVGTPVCMMDVAAVETLWGLPRGQNRTSTHKAFVFVSDSEIFKGPYPASSFKLVNNLLLPYLFDLLEQSLNLPDCRRGTYRWSRLLVDANGPEPAYYLAGDNVGRPTEMQVEHVSTAVDPQGVPVIRRGTLVQRASDLEKIKQGSRTLRHPQFDAQVAIASLQHLYFRYLLNVGDSGTHNILVRDDAERSGRLIAGIDFDEFRREQAPVSVMSCLFKKEHPYQDEIYGEFLDQIVQLDAVATAFQQALDQINAQYQKWAATQTASRRDGFAAGRYVETTDILKRAEQIRSMLVSCL